MKRYIMTIRDTYEGPVDILIQRRLWIGRCRVVRRLVGWCDVDRVIARYAKQLINLTIKDLRK